MTQKKSNKEKEVKKEETAAAKLKEKIVIPPNAKTIELTLEQLKETRTFADAYGVMPKQFPIEHHVFIQKVLDMCTEAKQEPVVGSILASVKNIERISKTEAESKALDQEDAENTTVKVLIGRIDLGNEFARKLWNLSIGFMYNEKGIEICVGTNIAICSNMTIYGPSSHFRNYSRNGVELSDMFKQIEHWLNDLENIDGLNSELLEKMIKVNIVERDTDLFIGKALKEAVRKNYHKGPNFPLTMSEVNRMTSYLIKMEDDDEVSEEVFF